MRNWAHVPGEYEEHPGLETASHIQGSHIDILPAQILAHVHQLHCDFPAQHQQIQLGHADTHSMNAVSHL
jgi:hypothetical protein